MDGLIPMHSLFNKWEGVWMDGWMDGWIMGNRWEMDGLTDAPTNEWVTV